MRELFFDIGGSVVRVTAPAGTVHITGDLAAFQIPPVPWDHTLELRFAQTLEAPTGQPVFHSPERQVWRENGFITLIGDCLRIQRRGSHSLCYARQDAFPQGIRSRSLLRAMEAEQLISMNGVLLHCSFIAVQNRGVLFTAPSGTGKSTQAALWQDLRGATVHNGDRAAVRWETAGFYAHGVPFSGSSGICRRARLPIAAIVYLSQAPKTAITRLTGVRAFRAIWEGCSLPVWDRQAVERCSETVAELVRQVPIYHLACTPDESAVLALENEVLYGKTGQ